MNDASLRPYGACLCAAALATLALNILVSPHLPAGSFAGIAASRVYVVRQVIAAGVAMLLVFGLIGVRQDRLAGRGRFAATAWVSAMLGQVLLFAIEYGQAFTVHDYALQAPVALDRSIADPHAPLAIGALIAIGAFYLGWLLLTIALLRARRVPRWCSGPLLVGFLATPALNAIKALGPASGIIASAIVGAGWFALGLQVIGGPTAAVGSRR